MTPLPPAILKVHFSPFSFSSLQVFGGEGGEKKMFQAKSIIEILHPTPPLVWPIGILQDLPAPYGVPNLQLGRKE